MKNNNFLLRQVEDMCNSDKSSKFYNITILANISALLFHEISNLNWLGFYILDNDFLYLGPFQGKVACDKIPVGKGVCGSCVLKNKTIKVDNVHLFAGHIACDNNSNSELVTPIYKDGKIFGVLDIDSPYENNFSDDDIILFEKIANIISFNLK